MAKGFTVKANTPKPKKADDWDIDASVWSVTSYSELHKEAEDVRRWIILHTTS